MSLAKTRAIYFSLFLRDLLDNHYVTATTGNLIVVNVLVVLKALFTPFYL